MLCTANLLLHTNQVWKIEQLRYRLVHREKMEPVDENDAQATLSVLQRHGIGLNSRF